MYVKKDNKRKTINIYCTSHNLSINRSTCKIFSVFFLQTKQDVNFYNKIPIESSKMAHYMFLPYTVPKTKQPKKWSQLKTE